MLRRLLLLLLGLALAVPAAPALALPSDPPVTALSPDDGVSLRIGQAGVTVGLTCPSYTEAGVPGDPFSDPGFAGDYRVAVSSQPAVGADGVLASPSDVVYPVLDGQQTEASTCHATITSLGTPGRYFWQPYRYCAGCAGGKEVGAVRSFTLVPDPNAVKLTIKPPRRAYAGFGTLVPITVDGTSARPAITLQRLKKGKWVKLRSINALNFKNDHVATFPAGRYPVRASISLPQTGTVTSPERTISVKRSKAGTPRSDGGYRDGRYDLAATVAKGGRQLKRFKANVSGTCPIPTGNGGVNLNPTIISVVMPTVRIAPDGRFARALPVSGYKIHLSGRLHGGRLTGTVVAETGGCSGTISAFAARR